MAGRNGAKDRIQEAAVRLMARKGVAGTTTQDIARRARCSQAAIYKYWESKESLARQEFDRTHADLIQAMESGAGAAPTRSEAVLGALSGLVQYARKNPAEYAFLFQVFHSEFASWLAPHKKPRDVVLAEIEAAMNLGEIPAGNPHLKAALLLGMAIRLAVFERQNLIGEEPARIDEGLLEAGAAVLEN